MLVCLLSQQAAGDPVLSDSRQETPVRLKPVGSLHPGSHSLPRERRFKTPIRVRRHWLGESLVWGRLRPRLLTHVRGVATSSVTPMCQP